MVKKRNPANDSFGVFSSASSADFLAPEHKAILARGQYGTQYERDFWERKLTEEDLSENMIHVHNAGKTYGKYLPFKSSKAPLLDRDACRYTREYTEKPMLTLQCEGNKKLAESFGPVRTKAGFSKNSITDYKSQYNRINIGCTRSEMSAAKPPMWTPPEGADLRTILGGKGDMQVKVSHNQSTHAADFRQNYDVNGTAIKGYKGNIELQGYHSGDYQKTSYQNEFNGRNQHRNQAVGTAFRQSLQRSSSEPGKKK